MKQIIVNRKCQGSITVEAALVLPIFLYGILAFLYVFRILSMQECIQAGLTEVAKEASRYGYVYEELSESGEEKEENQEGTDQEETEGTSLGKRMIESSFYKLKLEQYLSNCNMSESCILGGRMGITLLMSSFMEEDAKIDMIAVYQIKIPLAFIHLNGFSMVQRVRTRGFVGLDDNGLEGNGQTGDQEGNDQIVYITETGEVYHVSRDCSHIRLSIQSVLYSRLEELRNTGGGKYKPCERCAKQTELNGTDTIFITEDGDRYHTTLDCSGLKRTVIEIPLSQVGDRRACLRCR